MFRLSPCVGLLVPEPMEAVRFYERALGMRQAASNQGVELSAGPIRLFIDPGPSRPLVLELLTPDLAQARRLLPSLGLETLRWDGPGRTNLAQDPFGVVWNVHQDPAAFELRGLSPAEPGPARACVGALVPDPAASAVFYARVLEATPNKLADGSWSIDSGGMLLRVRRGSPHGPALWLAHGTAVSGLLDEGLADGGAGVLTDPFGVPWLTEDGATPSHAAVTPL